ncbi:MAG: hypothetical protein K0S74_245 [Chlamydiales bacterium]|jgi:hypothetical protein|nr:hypothetical protein [Chlamydiales bacterium]
MVNSVSATATIDIATPIDTTKFGQDLINKVKGGEKAIEDSIMKIIDAFKDGVQLQDFVTLLANVGVIASEAATVTEEISKVNKLTSEDKKNLAVKMANNALDELAKHVSTTDAQAIEIAKASIPFLVEKAVALLNQIPATKGCCVIV